MKIRYKFHSITRYILGLSELYDSNKKKYWRLSKTSTKIQKQSRETFNIKYNKSFIPCKRRFNFSCVLLRQFIFSCTRDRSVWYQRYPLNKILNVLFN